MYINANQGRVFQNCKFHAPEAGVRVLGRGHIIHIVKMHYSIKNYLILFSQVYIKQTKYLVMITKERPTKIVNFITPVAGVLVLERGHIRHIVKCNIF